MFGPQYGDSGNGATMSILGTKEDKYRILLSKLSKKT